MLRINQSVSALFIAAWCGIVISLAGPQQVPAPVPQTILAAIVPAEAPVDLPAVPLPTPEPVLVAPVVAAAILDESRYVTIAQFRATATAVGWPDDVLDAVTTVALCEAGTSRSGGERKDAIDTRAVSPWGDAGGLQINRVHAAPGGIIERMGYVWEQMLVLAPNLRVGLALYEARGFAPWTCSP